jgi:hypothetical protein
LFPLFFIAQWSHSSFASASWATRLRAALSPALFFVILLAILSLAILLQPSTWSSSLAYALHRPVSVESSPASVLWLLSAFSSPLHLDYTYGSVNLDSTWSSPVIAAFSFAFLVLFALICYLLFSHRLSLRQACLAALACLLLTNHFLSVQYLLWLLPLLALEVGLTPAWVAILLCTLLIYPAFYSLANLLGSPSPPPVLPAFLALSTTRNCLLAYATFRLFFPRLLAPSPSLQKIPYPAAIPQSMP